MNYIELYGILWSINQHLQHPSTASWIWPYFFPSNTVQHPRNQWRWQSDHARLIPASSGCTLHSPQSPHFFKDLDVLSATFWDSRGSHGHQTHWAHSLYPPPSMHYPLATAHAIQLSAQLARRPSTKRPTEWCMVQGNVYQSNRPYGIDGTWWIYKFDLCSTSANMQDGSRCFKHVRWCFIQTIMEVFSILAWILWRSSRFSLAILTMWKNAAIICNIGIQWNSCYLLLIWMSLVVWSNIGPLSDLSTAHK